MSKTEAQQIFDTVLSLPYGEVVELTFPLDTAADSFRSALYRERKNWAKGTNSKDQISITRDYSGFPFILEIVKVPGTISAKIKKQDGTEVVINFEEMAKPMYTIPSKQEKTELERQKELMRADGVKEEEIEEYFKGNLE